MSRHSLAPALGAALILASGCGVPSSGHLTRIDPNSVPFGLLQSASPSTSTSVARGPLTPVFLVDGTHLVRVERQVVGDNVAAEALRALLQGPAPDEAARGFATDVPTQTRLISLDVRGTIAIVDLSTEFGSPGGSDQVLAVAQIVYTVTATNAVSGVLFAIAGKRVEVPDGTGSLSSQPRTRRSFTAQAPTA